MVASWIAIATLRYGIKKWNLRGPVEVPRTDNKLACVELKERCGYMDIWHMGYGLILKWMKGVGTGPWIDIGMDSFNWKIVLGYGLYMVGIYPSNTGYTPNGHAPHYPDIP
jgi:hypothetical protein